MSQNEIFWTLAGQILGELYIEPHKRRVMVTDIRERQILKSGLMGKFPDTNLKKEWADTLDWLRQNGFVHAEMDVGEYSISSKGLGALGVDVSEELSYSEPKSAGQILSNLGNSALDETKRAIISKVVQIALQFGENFLSLQ